MNQYWVLHASYLLVLHPLSKYPGPKLWAISRLPWTIHTIKGDLWEVLHKFHARYGSYVRIAPDEITTIDPVAWKDIYMTRPVLAKDPSNLTPPLNGAHSLFTAEGETHRRIRAALMNGFSDKSQRDQAPIVESYADQLLGRLERDASAHPQDGVIDIQKLYGYATFDTVTDLSFGEAMTNALEGSDDHDENMRFFLHAKFGTMRNCIGRYWPLDTLLGLWMLRVTRPSRERNWRLTADKIDRRLSRGDLTGVRSDFLTPLVGKLSENGVKGSITKKELIANQLAFVIVTCQLNTVALSASIFLLLRRPSSWQTLAEEVRTRFKSADEITVMATMELPYLEAVINETMRLHHPTPNSLPRFIPPEGRIVNGQMIPGKVRSSSMIHVYVTVRFIKLLLTLTLHHQTTIGVNLFSIQNSATFWADPRGFHPERFLPQSDSRYDRAFDKDVKAAFQPFSVGPRNCIGSRVFLAQARVFLAKVIWKFDLELQGGQENWLDQKAWLVFEPKSLYVRLRHRADVGYA